MDAVRVCAVHEDHQVVVECHSCERDLCPLCWTHDVDTRPTCDECVRHMRERSAWALPALFATTLVLTLANLPDRLWSVFDRGYHTWFVAGALATIAATTYFLYRSERGAKLGREIVPRRTADTVAAPLPTGGPYRGAPVRRVVERLLPVHSGEVTTLAILGSLVVIVVLVKVEVSAAPWVEALVVLGASWVLWLGVLFYLLYRGRRVADDHGKLVPGPRAPDLDKAMPGPKEVLLWIVALSALAGPQMIIFGALLALVAAPFVYFGFGLAAVVPVVFLALYAVVGRGVRIATNDAPRCVGDVRQSLLRAAVFASTFTVPVGVLVAAAWLALRFSLGGDGPPS